MFFGKVLIFEIFIEAFWEAGMEFSWNWEFFEAGRDILKR